MPTVTVLKDKARTLGLTLTGNKVDLSQRILTHLQQKTYSDIKGYVPSDERCPKNKTSLVKLLVNTEKPLTIVTTVIEIVRSTDIVLEDQIDHVTKTTKEYRKTSIPKKLREAVWDRYIGADIGITKCPVCNITDIKQGGSNSWHCSHVLAECNGGTTSVDNLRVLCPGCNSSMSTMCLYDYAIKFGPEAVSRLQLDTVSPPVHSEQSVRQFTANELVALARTFDMPAEAIIPVVVQLDTAPIHSESSVVDTETAQEPISIKKDSLIIMCKSVGIPISKKNKILLMDELGNINNIITNQLNMKDLKDICKIESIKGYSKMKKDDLVITLLAYFFTLSE